jgi:glycosyltransferase involved in cell wall biosynthesis
VTTPLRLGVYVDDVYRIDRAGRISADRAFLLFACEVGRAFASLTLFGRTVESEEPADYVLPAGVRLVRLPHYPNLHHLRAVAGASLGTIRSMWRGLSTVDVVWVFGPHPFGFVLIAFALARRKQVVLGVRQDTVGYARSRMPASRRRSTTMLFVELLDRAHRRLARRLPTTVVGPAVFANYGGPGPKLLDMTVSLVPASTVGTSGGFRPTGDPVQLLTVGRLDIEKNPLLVVDMMAELERREPGRYRLTWIGRGALEPEVRARAKALDVDHLIELRGYVPFGEELLSLYRRADIFVHVSLTEGLPQVVTEALTCATPIVATAVGSVPAALDDGAAGLLVEPDDCGALVDAVQRLADDDELRKRFVERGLELAKTATLDHQAARVTSFIESFLDDPRAPRAS